MSWLLIQIWSSLAVAAFLGLLFGWAVRGVGLKGRLRRVSAERDLIGKDRDQLRDDLDALYSSKKAPVDANLTPATGGPDLAAEIAQRDEKLKSLGEELAQSKNELEALRSQASKATAAAAVSAAAATTPPAVSAPAPTNGDLDARLNEVGKERDELTWRNRYLESRVRMLEDTVSKIEAASGAAVTAAAPELAGQVETLKADNERLREEVDALKAEVEDGSPAGRPAQPVEMEQELARLRWRNRYLESRLDYLEGNPEVAAEEAAVEAEREAGAAAPSPTPPVSPMEAVIDQTEPSGQETPEGAGLSVEDPMATEGAPSTATAEAITNGASLALPSVPQPTQNGSEPVSSDVAEPMRLQGPRPEGADELAAIEGVGPMIERALNQLGIFHLDQVASWGPQEAIWVDRALGFNNGRVLNDDWPGKARKLIGTA